MMVQVIDRYKLNLIKTEVSRAAQQMQSNRPNIPFTGLEKALGYAAFQNWLGKYLEMQKHNNPNMDAYFEGCNHSARDMAITLMENLYKHPQYSRLISNKVKNINTITEIEFAKTVAYNQYWEDCTTRAVIMICRQLAYNYTGVLGEADFRLAGKGISWQELTLAVDQWLEEELA
ncbi:hypothetical protein CN481_04845 [Bacillus sp. AFS006103]|jgi:hypothetical protein|nr:hypothetical protein CN481_04845 [Bacillus sp. AFS006103]